MAVATIGDNLAEKNKRRHWWVPCNIDSMSLAKAVSGSWGIPVANPFLLLTAMHTNTFAFLRLHAISPTNLSHSQPLTPPIAPFDAL